MYFQRYARGQINTHTDTSHTDRHTDRHGHHNTQLPYRGKNKNSLSVNRVSGILRLISYSSLIRTRRGRSQGRPISVGPRTLIHGERFIISPFGVNVSK